MWEGVERVVEPTRRGQREGNLSDHILTRRNPVWKVALTYFLPYARSPREAFPLDIGQRESTPLNQRQRLQLNDRLPLFIHFFGFFWFGRFHKIARVGRDQTLKGRNAAGVGGRGIGEGWRVGVESQENGS